MTSLFEGAAGILRHHPEIALFLVLALGYLIGKIKVAGHAVGLVTGSLFAGLAVGQIGVEISLEIKTVFLLLFLFANGYGAGPQFFRALRSDGAAPLILTLVITFTGLLCVWGMASLMRLDVGFASGLLSGSLTQSPAIGTATEAIMALDLPLEQRQALVNHIPVADAVCYLFGFWGEVFYVAALLPRMIKVDLEREAQKLEAELGLSDTPAHVASAYRALALRGFLLPSGSFATVGALEAEAAAQGFRLFVSRIRRDGALIDVGEDTALRPGDILAIAGRTGWVTEFAHLRLGAEQDDPELLDRPVETLEAVVTKSGTAAGRTLGELADDHGTTRGLFVRSIRRGGNDIPVVLSTRLDPGDVVTLVGAPGSVEAAAARIGFAEKPSVSTDMFTLGFGIAVGCLIGLPTLMLGNVALSLSTSVGTLLAGLFFGWLRSVRPMLTGRVPEASQAFMVNFGLAGFVAITGLHAGPVFFSALAEVGIWLFMAGIVCTCVPPTVGAFFGRYVLKMNPVLLLGAVAGAQTMTAAMVAVQERAKSRAPVLGFTVPYALGNIILTTWGTVIVLLMSP